MWCEHHARRLLLMKGCNNSEFRSLFSISLPSTLEFRRRIYKYISLVLALLFSICSSSLCPYLSKFPPLVSHTHTLSPALAGSQTSGEKLRALFSNDCSRLLSPTSGQVAAQKAMPCTSITKVDGKVQYGTHRIAKRFILISQAATWSAVVSYDGCL